MTIRTKESIQHIRHNNSGSRLNHIIHQQSLISTKRKESKETSAESSATNDVEYAARSTVSELSYRINRHIDNQHKKRNFARQEQISYSRNRNSFISSPNNPTIQAKNSLVNKAKQQSSKAISDTFSIVVSKAETIIVSAFNAIKVTVVSSSNALIIGVITSSLVVVLLASSFFSTGGGEALDQPNFFNIDAYVLKNPYAQSGLYGQCTWFAWGRFYELYGYSPGFTGDGWNCAEQLVAAHPDTWELSDTPTDLCVFSGIGFNHVGIVINYQNDILTIQHANMDGKTNTFEEATKDWCEIKISLADLQKRYDGVVFSVPK